MLRSDAAAMQQLHLVRDIAPKGAYVAAGFLRNRVWDSLYSQQEEMPLSDVDVVYYDPQTAGIAFDQEVEAALAGHLKIKWQVRNQAYMHSYGGHAPFCSLGHALEHWPETATSIGVRLDGEDRMHFIAPFGFDDLKAHILRITPIMKAHDPAGFEKRLTDKRWLQRWPDIQVIR